VVDGLDWLATVANAISLAIGVASGSILSYVLLKRESKKMFRQVSETEVYKRFNKLLAELNELLGSEEARLFFKRTNELLASFVKSSGEEVKIKLPPVPKADKSGVGSSDS
jgi:hypothetical protein